MVQLGQCPLVLVSLLLLIHQEPSPHSPAPTSWRQGAFEASPRSYQLPQNKGPFSSAHLFIFFFLKKISLAGPI